MPCVRGCQHGRCSNICSEICSIEPCNENCPLLLPCGHPCIGLCGEPCPAKCAVCNSDDPDFEVFFGPEDEKDARFVQLVDCGHLIHAESIDTWVNKAVEEKVVGLPVCPKCRTPIRRTLRFNSQINEHLAKVEQVKAKLRGEEDTWHKCKVIKAIEDEAKEKILKKTDDGDNVFTEDLTRWISDLVRKVVAPEAALGVHQLSQCQQLLQSVYILLHLKQEPSRFSIMPTKIIFPWIAEPKKLENGGLNPRLSARRLQKKMDRDIDVLQQVLKSSCCH